MKTDEDYKIHAKALYIDLAEMQNKIIEQTEKEAGWIIATQQLALAIIDVDDSDEHLKDLVYSMQQTISLIFKKSRGKQNNILLKYCLSDFLVTVYEFWDLLHLAAQKKDHKKSKLLTQAFIGYLNYEKKKQILKSNEN